MGRRGDHRSEHERDSSGRYVQSDLCDACGKPAGLDSMTDDEVAQGGDGPGFYLCARKRCVASYEGKSVAERRRMFTAQRAKNDAMKRTGGRVATKRKGSAPAKRKGGGAAKRKPAAKSKPAKLIGETRGERRAARNLAKAECKARQAQLRAEIPAERKRLAAELASLKADYTAAVAQARARSASRLKELRSNASLRACVELIAPSAPRRFGPRAPGKGSGHVSRVSSPPPPPRKPWFKPTLDERRLPGPQPQPTSGRKPYAAPRLQDRGTNFETTVPAPDAGPVRVMHGEEKGRTFDGPNAVAEAQRYARASVDEFGGVALLWKPDGQGGWERFAGYEKYGEGDGEVIWHGQPLQLVRLHKAQLRGAMSEPPTAIGAHYLMTLRGRKYQRERGDVGRFGFAFVEPDGSWVVHEVRGGEREALEAERTRSQAVAVKASRNSARGWVLLDGTLVANNALDAQPRRRHPLDTERPPPPQSEVRTLAAPEPGLEPALDSIDGEGAAFHMHEGMTHKEFSALSQLSDFALAQRLNLRTPEAIRGARDFIARHGTTALNAEAERRLQALSEGESSRRYPGPAPTVLAKTRKRKGAAERARAAFEAYYVRVGEPRKRAGAWESLPEAMRRLWEFGVAAAPHSPSMFYTTMEREQYKHTPAAVTPWSELEPHSHEAYTWAFEAARTGKLPAAAQQYLRDEAKRNRPTPKYTLHGVTPKAYSGGRGTPTQHQLDREMLVHASTDGGQTVVCGGVAPEHIHVDAAYDPGPLSCAKCAKKLGGNVRAVLPRKGGGAGVTAAEMRKAILGAKQFHGKAYVSSVIDALDLDLDEGKKLLTKWHREKDVLLTRCDLVKAADREELKRSRIVWYGTEFDLVQTRGRTAADARGRVGS